MTVDFENRATQYTGPIYDATKAKQSQCQFAWSEIDGI